MLVDEKNDIRMNRSTVDHVSTMTDITETRKKRKLSTFCAFIDFRKAYDCIRELLWAKLDKIGISGKLPGAIKSLYVSVAACVCLNCFTTDWFDVTCGLKQGCCLSPLLFNLIINDLALRIKALGEGMMADEDLISILLYADDIDLISDIADDLQLKLNCLNGWCSTNGMTVNASKLNVVHFRPNSAPRINNHFVCGAQELLIMDRYIYLGITLNAFLDYNVTAKAVAQSSSRALGLLTAKFKYMDGMSYDFFTKLYDAVVWLLINYGASVWGIKSYSCLTRDLNFKYDII